jgi:putative nucleotidyltransferase with HDIG domain
MKFNKDISGCISVLDYTESDIRDNPLVILKLCRSICDESGSFIDIDTFLDFSQWSDELKKIKPELIRIELLLALKTSYPSKFFRSLVDMNALYVLFPEIHETIGVKQNKYHAYDEVFSHLMRTLEAACEFSPRYTDDFALFRLAAVLHDIGKPRAANIHEEEEVVFHNHDVIGTSMAYDFMKRLKFSEEDIKYVTRLIRHHQFQFQSDSKDKAIRKWLQKVGRDYWFDLILLRMADRKGNLAKQGLPTIYKELDELINKIVHIMEQTPVMFVEDLAINTADLKSLGIKPGPIYKQIFDNILGIVIQDQKKNNREFLLEFARRNYGPTSK